MEVSADPSEAAFRAKVRRDLRAESFVRSVPASDIKPTPHRTNQTGSLTENAPCEKPTRSRKLPTAATVSDVRNVIRMFVEVDTMGWNSNGRANDRLRTVCEIARSTHTF